MMLAILYGEDMSIALFRHISREWNQASQITITSVNFHSNYVMIFPAFVTIKAYSRTPEEDFGFCSHLSAVSCTAETQLAPPRRHDRIAQI
jgi:hypothetical protein